VVKQIHVNDSGRKVRTKNISPMLQSRPTDKASFTNVTGLAYGEEDDQESTEKKKARSYRVFGDIVCKST